MAEKFNSLPTPVKIIVFQAIANALFSVSEAVMTIQPNDLEMVFRSFARFMALTMFNLFTWYLTQLKETE